MDPITTSINIRLPFHYKCRDYQVAFWEAAKKGYKRFVLVWHRRAGKEKTCWNFLIMQAVKKVGIYYYFFPHFSQGRKILWDGVDKDGFRLLHHIPPDLIDGTPNSTEMKIRLRNGSLIQIIGTNNIDSIVGTNPVGCVFTEYSLQDPIAWQLIRPILVENGGWAVFNFTPRGANHGKDLYEMAQRNDGWFCELLTVGDTSVVSEADIQREREAGMSEDFIQQEFYCSFTLGIEGSYYAKYITDARDEDRIGNIPWNKQARVYTVWDLGYGDSTAIIFYQISGQEIHIIDYYENHGEGLPHYAGILKSKEYIYADHFAPHDIESHSFSSGLSGKEVGSDLGIRFITLPTLKIRLEDGIEALRGLFPRIWIDENKCKHLIKCLENYRKEFDQRLEVYKERPRHDKYSHGCFVGSTLIDVIGGKKRIDQIQIGDLILTPTGYQKVLNIFCYETKDLLHVNTTSTSFQCTPNHKIFTNNGLIYADAIGYNTTLFHRESAQNWNKLFGLNYTDRGLGFRENFLSAMMSPELFSMDLDFDGTAFTMQEEVLKKTQILGFKDVSGHTTMGKYLKAIISIIRTKILKTTISKIWNVSVRANTPCFMEKQTNGLGAKLIKNSFSALTTKPSFGTHQMKESNGIEPMLEHFYSATNLILKRLARFVKQVIRPKITNNLCFAQINVKLKPELFPESIMKKENVPFVSQSLKSINTRSKERVLNIVPLHLQTTQKVYDFEVEYDHCYYANDILVSNSDAARYMAIAVKRHVDAGKAGVSDDQAEKWFKQFNPRFD